MEGREEGSKDLSGEWMEATRFTMAAIGCWEPSRKMNSSKDRAVLVSEQAKERECRRAERVCVCGEKKRGL